MVYDWQMAAVEYWLKKNKVNVKKISSKYKIRGLKSETRRYGYLVARLFDPSFLISSFFI